MSTDLIIGLTVGIGGFLALAGIGYSMSKKTENDNDYNYDDNDTDYNAQKARESNVSRNIIRSAFTRANKDKYYDEDEENNKPETPDQIRVGGRKSKKSKKTRKSRK